MPDLTSCSAAELARHIRAREVSAVEVLKAHLDRIERQNPAVNAVVTLNAERARARAEAADAALARDEVWGPLHGVPFTVKDQFSTAGLRTTYALPHYADFVPAADAPQVVRLKEAGGVLMGKTNLPLAAYDWQCDHPNFGRANNPWALDCTPGGSSGGSAAALAAGLSPLELGADVAGSIRVPSHFCGVAGLRPTETGPLRGIRPPDRPATVRHIAVAGPMARTVEDLQLGWAALSGSTDAIDAPTPPAEALRIAVTPELGGVPVDTDTQRVLRDAVAAWRAAGCEVKRRPAPFDVEDAFDTWARIQGFELTAGLPAPLRTTPLRQLVWQGYVRSQYGFLAGRMAKGAGLSPRAYFDVLDRRASLADTVDAFFDDWDLWVTPVAATPAFTHRRTGADLAIEGVSVPYALPIAPYNCPTAAPGHPILTLPAGRSADGRPIGLQVHARHGADAALLAAGRRLEAALEYTSWPTPLDAIASSHCVTLGGD
ncbi:amidase [Salinibacter sp.]|uniref:amidase n=1 Tax=Salinibacter sp. TaxID=2065818 RepID=UPI0021E7CD14|nr:amidase [Salinibacter sp.]